MNGGMTVTNNQMIDTPTNNFATMNPSDKYSGSALSNGNLGYTVGAGSALMRATAFESTNKWYWEVMPGGDGTTPGIATSSASLTTPNGV